MKRHLLRLVYLAAVVVGLSLAAASISSGQQRHTARADQDTFGVGGTFALTGPAAAYGKIMSRGLQFGIDTVNAQGGAGGVELKANFIDMQGDAKLAALAAQKLISNHMEWISTHLTAPPLAQAPIVERSKVLLMNGAGNSPELATASPYLFSNVFLINLEQPVLFTWAKKHLHIKRVGILHGTSYSSGAVASAKRAFAALGVKVVASEDHPFGASDQRPQLEKIIRAKPDTIYLVNDATDTLLSLKQAYELGYRGNFLSSYVIIPDIPQLPAAQTAKLYTPAPTYKPDRKFVAAYKAKYGGESPSIFAAQFYDHALILRDVLNYLKRTGKEFTGENMRSAILKLKTFKTVSGQTTFQKNGTSLKPMDIYQIRNAKWVIIDHIGLGSMAVTLKKFKEGS